MINKIICLDDDEMILKYCSLLLKKIMNKKCYATIEIYNNINEFQKNISDNTLYIIDFLLEDERNGIDAINMIIKSGYKNVKIVLYSAIVQKSLSIDKFIENNSKISIIEKPNTDAISNVIRQSLGCWLLPLDEKDNNSLY